MIPEDDANVSNAPAIVDIRDADSERVRQDQDFSGSDPFLWTEEEGGYGGSSAGSRLAQEERDREDAFITEEDYWDAYDVTATADGWGRKTEEDYRRLGLKEQGISLEQYRSGLIWDAAATKKGLTGRTIDRARELRDLAGRSAEDYAKGKSAWQEDLEKNMASQIRNATAKQGLAGRSNRAFVSEGIRRSAKQAERRMISYIMQARTEESRHAQSALTQLLDTAAQQGEMAAVASEQMMNQWATNLVNRNRQEEAAMLSFFGTILAGTLSAHIASDERMKSVTGDTDDTAYNYLEQMRTAKYNMSPEMEAMGRGQGESGVMAQSLEDSEMGARSVVDVGGGIRGIEPNSGLRNTMVAQKEMHERLKHLEGRLGINREAGRG